MPNHCPHEPIPTIGIGSVLVEELLERGGDGFASHVLMGRATGPAGKRCAGGENGGTTNCGIIYRRPEGSESNCTGWVARPATAQLQVSVRKVGATG